MKLRLLWMVLVCLVGFGQAAAQENADLFILSEQVANTDDGFVSLDFVVREADGVGVRDLVPGSITLSEPADQITLTSEPRLNLALGIIVDLSFGSADDLIRQTLRAYVNTYYRDGDDLTLYILDGNTRAPRVVPIENREQALDVINALRSAPIFFRLSDALDTVFADMDAKGSVPSRPRHVIHVGSFLTAPGEATESAQFREIGVPFHVVHSHVGRPTAVMELFAESGGGLYVDNEDGALVLNDGQNSPVNRLKLLYDTIDTSRLVYTLRYRTLNRSLAPSRETTLTVALPDDSQASVGFRYDWEFAPPDVRFVNPSQLAVTRVPFRPNNNATLDFDEDTQPITVEVTFPDGVPRALETVRLEVVQTETGDVQQSTLQSTELGADGRLSLVWSMDEYSTPDSLTPVEVSVLVEDELGYAVTAVEQGEVAVAAAPLLPSPTPAPTVVASATEQTAGGVVGVSIGEGGAVVGPVTVGGVGIQTIFILLLVIVLLVLGLVFAISRMLRVYRLAREDKLIPEPEPTTVVDEAVAAPVVPEDEPEEIPEEEDAPEEEEIDPNEGVVAWLIITNGYEQIEDLETRMIDMRDEDFIIGRADDADWTLLLPYVSPRHCRIVFDSGEYFVRDMGSKNGTYINGERVETGKAAQVPVGSEIWVTKNIVLQLWDPQANLNPDDYLMQTDETAQNRGRELEYRSLPGIQPAFDADESLDDEYLPF